MASDPLELHSDIHQRVENYYLPLLSIITENYTVLGAVSSTLTPYQHAAGGR